MSVDVAKLYLAALTSTFNTPHEKMTIVNWLISLHIVNVKMPKIVGGLCRIILGHGIITHPDTTIKIRGSWAYIRLGQHHFRLTMNKLNRYLEECRLE